MKKHSRSTAKVTFADPLNWEPRPSVERHPYTDDHIRYCPECARLLRWTAHYMKNVNGR